MKKWALAAATIVCATASTVALASSSSSSGVIKGAGDRVASIKIERTAPLVVTGRHTGASNFIVKIVGRGATEHLFNEIGTYSGQTAVPSVKAGTYRVSVDGDGEWSLAFAQPRASRTAKRIPTTITGRGSKVVQVAAGRDLQPVVTASHTGQANFIVRLVPLGPGSGPIYLFNEIGRYRGQELVDNMARGTYLLAVQADGDWSVRIKP